MKPGIVLLHGALSNKDQYVAMYRHLTKNGFKTYEFWYNDINYYDVKTIALRLKEFVSRLKEKKLVFVGISKGGIIASYAIEYLGLNKRAKSCVTICSPFYGTYAAYIVKSQNQLTYTSPFLKGLREKIMKSKIKYYNIWNIGDMLVFPPVSAIMKGNKTKMVFAPWHYTTLRWTTRSYILKIIEELV